VTRIVKISESFYFTISFTDNRRI